MSYEDEMMRRQYMRRFGGQIPGYDSPGASPYDVDMFQTQEGMPDPEWNPDPISRGDTTPYPQGNALSRMFNSVSPDQQQRANGRLGNAETVGKERNALALLFQGALAAGDIDKASRLAVTPDQKAALSVAESQALNEREQRGKQAVIDSRAREQGLMQTAAPQRDLMRDYRKDQETQVAMSRAEQDRQIKMEQMRGQMAKTDAETRVLNARPTAPVDKPPPGYAWAAGGKLQAIPGGPADQKIGREAEKEKDAAQSFLDLAVPALENIQAMIGKRDAKGALIPGSKVHNGFESAVGATYLPGAKYIDGSDTADFNARVEQVKGRAFLEAFEKLKGGGAITEVEGAKATAAITRMRTSQSEKEFVQAAQEFQQVIDQGIKKAQMKVQGGQETSQGPQPMPTSKAALRAGQTYRTPRGMAVWNGTEFEAQ